MKKVYNEPIVETINISVSDSILFFSFESESKASASWIFGDRTFE